MTQVPNTLIIATIITGLSIPIAIIQPETGVLAGVWMGSLYMEKPGLQTWGGGVSLGKVDHLGVGIWGANPTIQMFRSVREVRQVDKLPVLLHHFSIQIADQSLFLSMYCSS